MMIPFYAVDSNYLDVYLARGANYSVSGIVKRVSVVDGGVKNRGRRGAQATEKRPSSPPSLSIRQSSTEGRRPEHQSMTCERNNLELKVPVLSRQIN